MAYYSSSTLLPTEAGLIDVFGPGDLVAGTAEDEDLAKVWVEMLAERENEIRDALDRADTATAERIWAEVEAAARAKMRSTANRIADAMGNDGMEFEAPDGRHIEELCEAEGGTLELGGYEAGNAARWEFADGSAIVVTDGAWDIEGDEPFQFEGA